MNRRKFFKALGATTVLAASGFLLPLAVREKIPFQFSTFQKYYLEIQKAMDDVWIYGSGAVQISPGGVNHVTVDRWSKALQTPDVKWFKLEVPKGETYGRPPWA